MYTSVVFVAVLVAVSNVRAQPEFDKIEIDEDSGLIKLDLKDTWGLVCHNDASDNIAKVACGGEGTSSEAGADALGSDVTLDFSVDMTCNGDEESLSKCEKRNIQALEKCDKFVAAHCGGRRSLRMVI